MKILYLSCHSVLEYDEVKLFTELAHDVYSVNGSYSNPSNPQDVKRPSIWTTYHQQLNDVAIQCSKENLHPELIEWADLIYIMHRPDWVLNNWSKMKHKKVVWRSIGQSTPAVESQLLIPRLEGLKIVRYSPSEKNIKGYIGEDAMIRFYKDENEFGNWNGDKEAVLNVTQAMRRRGKWCGYDIYKEATENLPRSLYGPSNEDSEIPGRQLTYDELRKVYRDYRVYFYTGTYPASYTLNFIEALMTGIPIVAVGSYLANLNEIEGAFQYEVSTILNGFNGYVADSIPRLREFVEKLLKDKEIAKYVGDNGRKTAIKLFGKSSVKEEWRKFLCSL